MSTKQYKQFKGLKKESLRDNMTNMEIALNMLAEASATELSKQRNPQGFNQQKRVAKTAFYKNLEVNVRMKQRFVDDVPSDVLMLIDKQMPRHTVFVLQYEGNAVCKSIIKSGTMWSNGSLTLSRPISRLG